MTTRSTRKEGAAYRQRLPIRTPSFSAAARVLLAREAATTRAAVFKGKLVAPPISNHLRNVIPQRSSASQT
jgi:hypothetical protein